MIPFLLIHLNHLYDVAYHYGMQQRQWYSIINAIQYNLTFRHHPSITLILSSPSSPKYFPALFLIREEWWMMATHTHTPPPPHPSHPGTMMQRTARLNPTKTRQQPTKLLMFLNTTRARERLLMAAHEHTHFSIVKRALWHNGENMVTRSNTSPRHQFWPKYCSGCIATRWEYSTNLPLPMEGASETWDDPCGGPLLKVWVSGIRTRHLPHPKRES